MSNNIQGKVVAITGAGSGLGEAARPDVAVYAASKFALRVPRQAL